MRTVVLVGIALMVAGLHEHGAAGDPSPARLAQFGPMTKKPAVPVPQRTAASTTRQNVERRGAQPEAGGAFGGMHKQGDPRPRVTPRR